MGEFIERGAVKVIEVIGISQKSFEDAVEQGVEKATQSIDAVTGIEVLKFSARVEKGNITEYHADMKLAFAVR